jgi:hypothetical protein
MALGKVAAWKGGGGLFQSEWAICLKERPVSLRLEEMGSRTSVMKK